MRIVAISPESRDPREDAAIGGLIGAGLELYHVRKPWWGERELEEWILGLPEPLRPALVLHQHHGLVARLGLGGAHHRDGADAPAAGLSRSCHDLEGLRSAMAGYGQVLFGPVFPSLSKPGHGPAADFPWDELQGLLRARRPGPCRVLAVGGITAERLGRCRELGFDGVAVKGALWSCGDPVLAYRRIREAAHGPEAPRHAA